MKTGEVRKNIQLRFIDRFLASSLDKLPNNLYGTGKVKCDKSW